MAEDMSNLFQQFKHMLDNGNLPDDLQKMVSNLSGSSSESLKEETEYKISPEMINSFSNLFHTNSEQNANSTDTASSSSNNNIDIETILRMKKIIETMNQKDDPRSKLLYSLKPYLRDSRKNKLDQYVGLLNMTKIADVMKTEKKENNNDS